MSDPTHTTLRKLRHDLRTGLGQIIGYGELLEEEMRERALGELLPDLGRIEKSARTLLDLTEQVFGGSAMEPLGLREPRAEIDPIQHPASGGHILVVDDDADNRAILSRLLERRGYQVTTAASGVSALRAIGQEQFDIVILDVLMPGMSGLEVLESIRREHPPSDLPVVMATALGGSVETAKALRLGANDYVTKPIDPTVLVARLEGQFQLKRATEELTANARHFEIQSGFIRHTFGRYVSDEVVRALLEKSDGLDISGERRAVTILMCDLRGFSSLTQTLSATEIVTLLNGYLGTMAEVIQSYDGTIDNFIGDAILALFGAPVSRHDDTERAVACALAMQQAMAPLNVASRARGLPDLEMGVGIATGEVVVGNLGSEKRAKYSAIGTAVNLAARIESYTLGGEVWIDASTREALGPLAEIETERTVHPKGFAEPVCTYRISGIGGQHAIRLPVETTRLVLLEKPLRVRISLLDGKQVSAESHLGEILSLSANAARLFAADAILRELSDVRITLWDEEDCSFYAKVVAPAAAPGDPVTVRFTVVSPPVTARLEDLWGREPGR